MTQLGVVLICLAYIVGLLSTPVSWGGYAILALGIICAIARFNPIANLLPYFWRTSPKSWVWITAGIVGFLATIYFQFRIPQPTENNISNFIPNSEETTGEIFFTVWGNILTTPRITRSQKAQFWLEANQLNQIVSPNNYKPENLETIDRPVSGKLYVTVPLLQATGLYPGQNIAITGKLYKPKPASNPGGFDFKKFLAREDCFAGLVGKQIRVSDNETQPYWGWWMIRQKILRSQVKSLGVPEGTLVSAMVIGNKAVDLPYNIQDNFRQVGLSHALAASGFQISLILGLILTITKRFTAVNQFGIGIFALLLFLGLTGVQPSVMRAVIMGIGVLIALVMQRKINTLGSLLLAATLLLLFNPLWIEDLGFQLSFLSTFGLLVTVPGIMKKLDWMPPTIASIISVPLAASIWTLPLQIYYFGLVSPYSILVNIITVGFIAIISLGGFISAMAAIISPEIGSYLSSFLYYPTNWLIEIVNFFCKLPGNSVAVGSISLVQMVIIYLLIFLVLIFSNQKLQPQVNKTKKGKKGKLATPKSNNNYFFLFTFILGRWWIAFILAVSVIIIPVWQAQISLFKLTILEASGEPVLVIQDKGKVTLVNSGNENTVQFTVLPFLQQQGINQIDWAIATNSKLNGRSGWAQILEKLTIKNFYDVGSSKQTELVDRLLLNMIQADRISYSSLPLGQLIQIGATNLQLINTQPSIVQFQIGDMIWLWLGDLQPDEQRMLLSSINLSRPDVLWWSGKPLQASLLQALQPKVAIASANSIDPETANILRLAKTEIYSTSRDGAIQWTPNTGFETMLENNENNALML